MFKLILRGPTAIPIELDGITPTRAAGLSAAQVANLPVQCGNRADPLGEFFDVTVGCSVRGADLSFAGDTRCVKGIGLGMTAGFIYVENDAGMHAGAGMTGGSLIIDGSAGDWLGAEMSGGTIEVRGNAGDQVGAAYRGSRWGMRGGVIHLRGNAGAELGLLMRRGLIAVEGQCGDYAGASMIAGTIVAAGGGGRRAAAGMKRGTLLVGREPELHPGMRFSCEYQPAFLGLLLEQLRSIDFGAAEVFNRPIVRCYRGDILYGGNGELWVPAGSVL